MKKFISWNVNGLRACMGKGFMDFFDEIDAQTGEYPALQSALGNDLAVILSGAHWVDVMKKGVNKGTSGRVYGKREGFCMETQFAPDSINHPEFIDSVLRAGEKYDFTTIFAFDVEG